MTTVNGGTRTPPPSPRDPVPSANGRPQPESSDVRAMAEAFDAARGKMERGGPMPGGKKLPPALAQAGRDAPPETGSAPNAAERGPIRHRSRQDANEGMAGWAGGSAVAAVPVVTADVAAAHVDPGAFAQMLADLWTRENGKGAKEVLVRFGSRSWPATGARLVRNAAGGLDVSLMVGDGGRAYGDRLPQLEAALGDAGVNLGSLELSADA